MLSNPANNVSTRIILLSYHDIWKVDRRMLDDIAFALDLDPLFLWCHFDDDLSSIDNPFDDAPLAHREGPLAQQIPSDKTFFEIKLDYYDGNKLSALVLDPSEMFKCTTGT